METNANFLGLPEETSQSIYMPYLSTNYKAEGATNIQTTQVPPVDNIFQGDILATSAGISDYNIDQTNTYTTTQTQNNYQTNDYTNFDVPITTEAYPATNYTTTNQTEIPITNYEVENNYTTTEAYPTTNYADYTTTNYATTTNTFPEIDYTAADTFVETTPTYETTNNYLDILPTTTTNYDFNEFEAPKYEINSAPVILPQPQYKRKYYKAQTVTRYEPRIVTNYKQVPVTSMVPVNAVPQVPPPVPTPSIVPPQPLYSPQNVEPIQQRPLPINDPPQPLVNIPQQPLVNVPQSQMISQVPSFEPQVDGHFVRNYPIWENDPRREILKSIRASRELSPVAAPGTVINPT